MARRELTHSPPGAVRRFNERQQAQERQRDIRIAGFVESGAHLFSAMSSLYQGQLNARAAALDASWQETAALYDEVIINDEVLNGMAAAEVAFAHAGARGASALGIGGSALEQGEQWTIQLLDAAGKAARMRRSVQLRARVAAARALFGGANARALAGQNALSAATKAGSAIERAQERAAAL